MTNEIPAAKVRKSRNQNPVLKGLSYLFQAVKLTWLAFWLFIATTLVFPPIMLSTLFSQNGNFPFHLSKIWARLILSATGVKLKVTGREKIKQNQSYIIISNHQSHLDGPAIVLSLGIQFRWVAKKELLKIPVFGHCLYACGNIFIDRSAPEKALRSIEEGIASLDDGVGVMFFAEGTRSSDGRLNQFKKGGFSAALQTGLPILPVTVNGSAKVLAKNKTIFSPGSIEVIIDDPIDTSPYTFEAIESLIDDTKKVIRSNLQLD